MLNVSSAHEGQGAGVLIRALEPVQGTQIMQGLRGVARWTDLARGPGRLAQALSIERHHDGLDLCRSTRLWLAMVDTKCPSPAPAYVSASVAPSTSHGVFMNGVIPTSVGQRACAAEWMCVACQGLLPRIQILARQVDRRAFAEVDVILCQPMFSRGAAAIAQVGQKVPVGIDLASRAE